MKVSEMSDEHVRNRLNWLLKKRDQELEAMHTMVALAGDGDMGQSMNNSVAFYEDEIKDAFEASIMVLRDELVKRSGGEPV